MAVQDYDLPKVNGELHYNVNLSKYSFFGAGGSADVLFIPSDADDLVAFLREHDKSIPVTIIGACSNLIIRDGGVRGVVVKLGAWFDNIFIKDDILEVGGANSLPKLANKAADNGLSGLEFLSGIPGSIGGALIMNAGCYGSCIADVFAEAEAIDFNGIVHWLNKENVNFEYRHTSIKDLIITRVWLKCSKSDTSTVAKKMNELLMKRKNAQTVLYRSCGSAFKNPEGDKKAWQLIDQAGCRGLKVGDAMVSDSHCNFIVNTGKATAAEIEELGEEVRRRVKNMFGIELQWEIVRIGEHI